MDGSTTTLSVTTKKIKPAALILLTEVIDMTEQLFSIRDCGKAVGIAAHKIAYAHTQERLAHEFADHALAVGAQ